MLIIIGVAVLLLGGFFISKLSHSKGYHTGYSDGFKVGLKQKMVTTHVSYKEKKQSSEQPT